MKRCVIFFVILNLSLHIRGELGQQNELKWNVTEVMKGAISFDLPGTRVILKEKRTFNITLMNFKIKGCLKCSSKFNGTSKFETECENTKEFGKDILKIKVADITDDMSTKWNCSFYKPNGKLSDFTFTIRIKEKLNVTIGGLELQYTTDESDLQYDGVVEYLYMDGEYVDYVCQRRLGDDTSGFIILKYYNATGTMLFENNKISAKYNASYQSMMSYDNKDDKIDCIYQTKLDIRYTYRTIFRYGGTSSPVKSTDSMLLIIVSCAIVISAISLVCVCLIIFIRLKRNKRALQAAQQQIQGVRGTVLKTDTSDSVHDSEDKFSESCESLTRELGSPIPAYPNQWQNTPEDAANADGDIMITNSLYGDGNPIYALPQKNTKPPSEHLYHTEGPVYNVPDSDLYSSINSNLNTAQKHPYLDQKNVDGSQDYSQLCNKKYTYDYILDRNASTSDYVEPAYCEVFSKK